MSEHVNGTRRDQTVLFPNAIDQYVEKDDALISAGRPQVSASSQSLD